ncbi:ABC transporter permease [Cellulosilyticum ruminicola]|uniref:ABC transporter permease n=1 Tax=Cellulosilyticum ruminicola TaxID=425254 RepID=UPI0006D110A4|nr:ABC transporter permease [Cellulosilyticum ruminicola]
MNATIAMSAVELGLLFTLLTLGLFISYRILDIPDLTVDGSFTLGAVVSVIITMKGSPELGILAAAGAGTLAGMVTAILQTKLKIQPILAGILTMTGLYSINLMIMGKPNLSLLGEETIFTKLNVALGGQNAEMVIGVIGVVAICILLGVFLHTNVGLAIRATGDNEDMVRSSSINVDHMKIIGLAIANALVALSGALVAQKQASADTGMGTGMVVIGIASLIIGEVIVDSVVKQRGIKANIVAAIIGSIIYRLIISLALTFEITATSMKLISAIIVAFAISYPVIISGIKGKLRQRARMKEEM